ncbi:sensor histidine kinase [Prosthecomicrobium pneumaticum]|uniref:histidine kinase n=1 Tax=Prosthecomicrobium pneumaticum TaxID=81895 RepID=A0A7W9L2Y8_9HYPH|nr:HWE histidine kinase domain-containing protein [Prosthecomicrobium pneumaticum]MBB5753969.1 two-component sensor histidine kinase [Prosthecomicrobium pneumaticum]
MSRPSVPQAPPRILLLEDSPLDADLIAAHLDRLVPAPDIVRATGRADYAAALEAGGFDVILSDYSLPGFDGMMALDLAKAAAPDTPFIFVSGVLGEEIAIDSFRRGATDYVLKQRLIRLPAAIERALAETREREERRRAERQLELLVAELSHRVKNTLAMVMSIARRTARGSGSVAEYEEALISRLRALAEAHALLFEANWGDTSLRQILERTLDPFRRDGERTIGLSGPRVPLAPKAALALSLILHELVTNAMKYGALSSANGRVDVSWTLDESGGRPMVDLVWRESGGPEVAPPTRAGFGSTLVDRSIRYELDGTADLDFAPTGVVCRLRFVTAV